MSSSLDDLNRCLALQEWAPDLGPRRSQHRRLFVCEEFVSWTKRLPTAIQPKRLVTPQQELSDIAADFVAGEKIVTFIHRIDPPKGQGILRFSTTSFRLAGWAADRQVFVLGMGALVEETHGPAGGLTKLGNQVVGIRKRMGITTWAKGQFHELFRADG